MAEHPVQVNELLDVLGDDKCRLNNSLDTEYPPLPSDEIYRRAMMFYHGAKVDATAPMKFEQYNLIWRNCEHFAHFLRNDIAVSKQVQDFYESKYQIFKNLVSGVPAEERQLPPITPSTSSEMTSRWVASSIYTISGRLVKD